MTFSGSTVPHSIQVDLTHDPDTASGGVGKVQVINTRGDIKSIAWTDDGANLWVLLTPTKGQASLRMKDFKFYVAGDVTGFQVLPSDVSTFDINGNAVSGVTASVQ